MRTPGTARADGAVLSIHGSGYAVCSSRTHRGLTSHISEGTGLPVSSIDYRLAPSHRYPAASGDIRAAWDWLLGQGYAAGRVVVAGDSADGHLLGLELARAGEPLPAALVTLSPVVDLSLRLAVARDRVERDPFAAATVARGILATYADAESRRDEGLRLEFAGLDAFPPTRIHAGSTEMLSAECTELARRIRNAGFTAEHRVWPGQMHVFQAMTAVVTGAAGGIGRSMATELAEGGIRVAVLCPTFVKTNIFSGELIETETETATARIADWVGTSPQKAARMTLDGHDKGRRCVVPQLDARAIRLTKRLIPTTHARVGGLLSRLASFSSEQEDQDELRLRRNAADDQAQAVVAGGHRLGRAGC